jgi:hypothetical protein
MAEWFTAEHRWALIRRYGLDGPKTPEQMAIEEACELSSEVRKLWATRDKWSRHSDDFSRLLWPKVFRVLGIDGGPLVGPATAPHDDTERVTIPYELVEAAVKLHVEERFGRRPLGTEIAGLGEWGARVVLYSLNTIGKPAGLWLDNDGRLSWGAAITPIWDREQGWEQRRHAIAPTPAALSLPRPSKPT